MTENMRINIMRGLPEVVGCKPHNIVMSIAGGGPSLEDTWHDLEGFVCAINGSLQWLLDKGLVPHACGICDAGEHITDMVPAHPDVRYYVASICHPSLFEKLAGCDVRMFHITPASTGDEEAQTNLLCVEYDEWIAVGGGCTMGLRWFNLGYLLGFRTFYGHGLDSSFRGKSTHAYPDRADQKNHMEFGGRMTRPNFIAQVHDFAEMLEVFHERNPNISIEIFGDGLLQDEWKAFREANPDAFKGDLFELRVAAFMRQLPATGPVKGAEIGVWAGRFSRRLLQRPDLKLLMVDSWEGDGTAYTEQDVDNFHGNLSQKEQDFYKKTAIERTEFAANRRKIVAMRSLEAANCIADGSLDFVFIDADHSYEGCKADIEAWRPKLRRGGLLSGHDYSEKFPGVMQAVNEYIDKAETLALIDDDATWFVIC